MSQRFSHHHRRRLHPVCRPRLLEGLLCGPQVMMSQRTTHHHRRRLHRMCRLRPLEGLLCGPQVMMSQRTSHHHRRRLHRMCRPSPPRETSARGTPVGSLLSRALRREHYAPEILRVVEPVLNPVRSDTTAGRNDFVAADVMTTKPGVAATALIEAPTDATPAPHASDRPPQVNWADNEAFHFNPEAHCLSTVPSASPHPEGMQYGPARRSSRACAKMLVRAGHRCPACFCLTSLCRCPS